MSKQNRFAFLNEQLSKLLETDPEGLANLATLEGCCLVLLSADIAFGLELTVTQGQLQAQPLTPSSEAPKVIGGLLALKRMVQGRKLSVDALLGACEIDGDADEVRRWFEVLVNLRPDFAKPFAGLLADEQLEGFLDVAGNNLRKFTAFLTSRQPPSENNKPDG